MLFICWCNCCCYCGWRSNGILVNQCASQLSQSLCQCCQWSCWCRCRLDLLSLLFVGAWSCCYCCGHGKVSVVRRHCHCRYHCGCQVVVVMLFELLTGLMLEKHMSSQQWHWRTTVPTTKWNNQMVSRSVEQAISKPEADMYVEWMHIVVVADVRCVVVVVVSLCRCVVLLFSSLFKHLRQLQYSIWFDLHQCWKLPSLHSMLLMSSSSLMIDKCTSGMRNQFHWQNKLTPNFPSLVVITHGYDMQW
jgi:hypothetical protein